MERISAGGISDPDRDDDHSHSVSTQSVPRPGHVTGIILFNPPINSKESGTLIIPIPPSHFSQGN